MKLNTCRALLLAVAIGAALAVPAGAQDAMFIDFGDSAQPTPGNYNHIFVNDTTPPNPDMTNPFDDVLFIADLIDETGANTGISLSAEGFFKGSNQSGTTAPTGDAAIFHPQATRDNAFGHAGPFGTNPLTPEALLTFTGLNPLNTYDFTFFASRVGLSATDIRETEYRVLGTPNNTGALLNASNNTSNVAQLLGLSPSGAGEIQLLVDPGPNNSGNASIFYYLGALRIDCIPEPASGVLLMRGVVGVLMVQRHRGAGRRA